MDTDTLIPGTTCTVAGDTNCPILVPGGLAALAAGLAGRETSRETAAGGVAGRREPRIGALHVAAAAGQVQGREPREGY